MIFTKRLQTNMIIIGHLSLVLLSADFTAGSCNKFSLSFIKFYLYTLTSLCKYTPYTPCNAKRKPGYVGILLHYHFYHSHFVAFLSGFRSQSSHKFCFTIVFVIICVSPRCFIDEWGTPCTHRKFGDAI